ncbi:thioredoxin family protein [Aquabacterium sp. OR-4]|uniref:thioredoxin family protein n=1 Tax=Aquabacterium sp. OR-4 TaxID=2978127 RepID=UPI0021B20AF3|nr:thioredoxin family protein [Aquabacterium sp. OR-4]MDT7833751.1 thioredoxin family protein [Aquabacterium sp. OR-4]
MSDTALYLSATEAPSRAEIDALAGPLLLEFGTGWCGHCRAARPLLASALQAHPGVRHLRVEDGPGRALGRGFGVKLWPTLLFLRDGQELARLVRPQDAAALARALAAIDAPGGQPGAPAA